MSSKGFIFMMLALVFFIPGAYSISVSLSGGDAGSSFSDVLTIGADVKDSVSVYSLVKGSTLEQDASGNGNLHKSFSATNHKGENAHIIADIVNAGYWEYNQPVISTDATSASVSGFGLTATDADSIKCTAGVSNRKINKANAIVEVYGGSLINYQADASARSDGVALSQSFDQASGDRIAVSERASNPTGYASTKTNVEDGSLFGYSNEGSTYANSQSLQTLGQFDEAIGEKIASESSAYKSCGYRSNVMMNVEGNERQDGQVIAYNGQAGVGLDGLNTITLLDIEDIFGPLKIYGRSLSGDMGEEVSGLITGKEGGLKKLPGEEDYVIETGTGSDVHIKIGFESAHGKEIKVELKAKNPDCLASDNIQLASGDIFGYTGFAKSTSAELDVKSECGSLKGDGFHWNTKVDCLHCFNEFMEVDTTIKKNVSIKGIEGHATEVIWSEKKASQKTADKGANGEILKIVARAVGIEPVEREKPKIQNSYIDAYAKVVNHRAFADIKSPK